MAASAALNLPAAFLPAAAAAGGAAAWGGRMRLLDALSVLDPARIMPSMLRARAASLSGPRMAHRAAGWARVTLRAERPPPRAILMITGILLRLGPARRLERRMAEMVRAAIQESGSIDDPRRIARFSLGMALISAAPAAACGSVLGMLASPAFFAVAAVPAALLMGSMAQLRMARSQRRRSMEHELPAFIACASTMEEAGCTLYAFLGRLARARAALFPAIQRDAAMFARNAAYMAMPHADALRKVAATHPSRRFRDFVNDYTSSYATSGASTANMLASASESAFRGLQFRIRSYVGDAQGIAQVMLLVMAMAPITSIAASMLATGSEALGMTLLMALMMPAVSLVMIAMVDGRQPRTHNAISFAREGIAAGAVVAVAMALAGRPAWEALGVASAACFGINAACNMGRFRMLDGLDRAMPSFLQDVTDGMAENMSIYECIGRQTGHAGKALSGILAGIYRQMFMGESLIDAAEGVRTKSWLSHMVFFVLGHVHESGGASAKTMQAFTNFVREHQESRQEMAASLRGPLMMGYAIPLIMGLVMAVSMQLTDSISSDFGDLEGLPISVPSAQDARALADSSFFLVVLCSILIGLIVSKMAYLTLRHTLHTCILACLSVAICHAVPLAPPLF